MEALREALIVAGRAPEIFNTDQGCQFTSRAWITTVEESGAKVSMDGKGRWMDNVWDLEIALGKWFADYNHWKQHESLGYKTPWECYRPHQIPTWKREAA